MRQGAHILVQLAQSGTWWWCFCKIFPSTSNVQAGSRTSAQDGNKEEPRTHGASVCPTFRCHTAQNLRTYPHRAGTTSPSSSSGLLSQPPSFSPHPNISISFKKNLPKLSDKSLYINMFKRGERVSMRETVRVGRPRDGGGGREGGREGGIGYRRQENDSFSHQESQEHQSPG